MSRHTETLHPTTHSPRLPFRTPSRNGRRIVFFSRPAGASWMIALCLLVTSPMLAQEPLGTVTLSGELKQWHKVTLTLVGPEANEAQNEPNPFLDYAMTVRFLHESGDYDYLVPGYFAADGQAAETSADEGNCWRAHLCPDVPGKWLYAVSFLKGPGVAVGADDAPQFVTACNGVTGEFTVAATDKKGRDFRHEGRLEYVGKRYLRFKGSGRYFLKAGPDAPETFLAYEDFDGTFARDPQVPLKSWTPHLQDWREGDPTWRDGKGKGIIGALNYLSEQGCNAVSFLTYNAGGDGNNVWPHRDVADKTHFDCSKLDQWQIVFDHAQQRGLYLHFKLQETENDDNRLGPDREEREVPDALDGGALGVERKLYLRELVARFGHSLALNWNLGEENSQLAPEQRAMSDYLKRIDPYQHHRVMHTYPQQQKGVYTRLLGDKSSLTGVSLQNSWSLTHNRTLLWVEASQEAGKPWVVAQDEQNPASQGVPPDPGYQGHDGVAYQNDKPYTLHDIRQRCLWGNLMAGGAGVEYYFGYELPENDLLCEDYRSRHQSWEYCRIALEFFSVHNIPFWEMENADPRVGNSERNNLRYCFAKDGELYIIYLPRGRKATLDLSGAPGSFAAAWFNPRRGGDLLPVEEIFAGDQLIEIGQPPEDPTEDWVVLVRKTDTAAAAKSDEN